MSGPTKFQIKKARRFGRKFHVKPSDLLDVIEHESGFDPLATEHGGSVSNTPSESQGGGLTQFIPSTAREYGVKYGGSKKAQKTQIRGEAHYLHDLGYGGGSPSEVQHALAGYYGAASPYASDVISSHQYDKYDSNLKQALGNKIKSGGGTKTTTLQTKPAVSMASERAQAALAFIQDPEKDFQDILNYETTVNSLQDKPAQFKTITSKKPGSKSAQSATVTSGGKKLTGGPKKQIVEVGKLAEKQGLSVGENPHFGGVDPVHVTGSYHYKARAIDVSGSTEQMRAFAHFVAKKYGKHITELFWQGPGGINIKNGENVEQGYVTDHTDHVHVAI